MQRAFLPTVCSVLVLGGAATAAAGGRLPPLASEQDPPRIIDETDLQFELMNRPGGYAFIVKTTIYGKLSPSDAVRVDFTQKGKVLASERCPLDGGESETVKCRYDGKPIKALGAVTANLILIDDQEEKEYLLRQLNMTVVVFPWMKEKNYQVVHDDMLGTAFAWHRLDDDDSNHKLDFYIWTTGNLSEHPQLRCKVNGKKEADFATYPDTALGGVSVDAFIKGKQVSYKWGPVALTTDRLFWGTAEEVKEATRWEHDNAVKEGYRYLADLAGDWACDLRFQGKAIRQFAFKVNDKGRIQPSDAQGAAGFPKLAHGVVHIDMRLPAKNSFDTRVRPDAIKKSMPYGMPWPKHPAIEAFKKSLPPASGLADLPGK